MFSPMTMNPFISSTVTGFQFLYNEQRHGGKLLLSIVVSGVDQVLEQRVVKEEGEAVLW